MFSKADTIESSPFFEVMSKRKLYAMLFLTEGFDEYLESKPYRSFQRKGKTVDDPYPRLKKAQDRVRQLLVRTATPPWMAYGKKGCSYVKNASFHREAKFCLTVDLTQFYEHCGEKYVFRLFAYTFKQSPKTASKLTQILTHKGYLPRGSPASQILTYWIFRSKFQEVYEFAQLRGISMTMYVDDMTFSSASPITASFKNEIVRKLGLVGLRLNNSKTRFYEPKDFKLVTGVAISPDGDLRVPNRRRKLMLDLMRRKSDRDDSFMGRLRNERQIESKFFSSVEL